MRLIQDFWLVTQFTGTPAPFARGLLHKRQATPFLRTIRRIAARVIYSPLRAGEQLYGELGDTEFAKEAQERTTKIATFLAE